MSNRRELTDYQKGQIEGRLGTMSHLKIGEELGIPRRTVTSFLQRLAKHENQENLPRSGRPRKTSKSTDRYLVYAAERDSDQTLKELRNTTNIGISIQTIRRRLHEAGIQKWRAKQRALLNTSHAAQRYKWAKEHRHLTRDDFAFILYTDESLIKKNNDSRSKLVFRRRNKNEKYMRNNVQGKTKGRELSQMVWGCFIGNKLGPLVFINQTVDRNVYIQLLEQNLLSFIDMLHETGIQNIVFQQDNATPHHARVTRDWLKAAGEHHGFTVMEFPPNSPDLNPIEHLWSILKAELYRRYPDTMYLKGSESTVRGELRKRLNEIWWDIGEDVLNKLIDSMPNRIQAVLKARGWYTEY
jgi:transposase